MILKIKFLQVVIKVVPLLQWPRLLQVIRSTSGLNIGMINLANASESEFAVFHGLFEGFHGLFTGFSRPFHPSHFVTQKKMFEIDINFPITFATMCVGRTVKKNDTVCTEILTNWHGLWMMTNGSDLQGHLKIRHHKITDQR